MAEEIIKENILPVESIVAPDPEPKPKPNPYVKKVHENLLDAYGSENVPKFEIFAEKIKNPKYKYAVRENLIDVYGKESVPDFNAFTDSLNLSMPEKKNLVVTGGTALPPTESGLLSTQSNIDNKTPSFVNENDGTLKIDESKNPLTLLKESKDNYNISFSDRYKIKNYVESKGVPSAFTFAYKELGQNAFDPTPDPEIPGEKIGAYANDERILSDLQKYPFETTKRINLSLFGEKIMDGYSKSWSHWTSNAPEYDKENNSKEEYNDAQAIQRLVNNLQSGQNSYKNLYGSDSRAWYNLQNDAENGFKYIDKYIQEPEEKKIATKALVNVSSDLFGSTDEMKEYSYNPLGKGLNIYQSIALNYLRKTQNPKAEFFDKYKDTDINSLDPNMRTGYETQAKQLEEVGIDLHLKWCQQQLKEIENKIEQGTADEKDLFQYKDIQNSANDALKNLNEVIPSKYPNVINKNEAEIAQDFLGTGSGITGTGYKKLASSTAKLGLGIYDLLANPFRSQEEIDNAALASSSFEQFVDAGTINRPDARTLKTGKTSFTPELLAEMNKIKNSNLPDDEKNYAVRDLLRTNSDKYVYTPPDAGYNWGIKMVAASVTNFAGDITPFIVSTALTGGARAAPGLLARFGNLFANVLMNTYEQEIARATIENNPNPQSYALGNILVNSLAYEAAGVATNSVKYIRGAAAKMGGLPEKVVSKLDDATIAKMLANPPSKIKTFFTDLGKTAVNKAGEGVKNAAIFEAFMGAKEASEGKDFDIAQHGLNMLNFALFHTVAGTFGEMSSLNKANKNNLYLAALNIDEVKSEAQKALDNNKITKDVHDQVIKNVEAAGKVLEKVPMVDEDGKRLNDSKSAELLYLKIKDQNLLDLMKKDIPAKLKTKLEKQWWDNQNKINNIVRGSDYSNAGAPFEGFSEGKMGESTEEVESRKNRIQEIEKIVNNHNAIVEQKGRGPLSSEALQRYGNELDNLKLQQEKSNKVAEEQTKTTEPAVAENQMQNAEDVNIGTTGIPISETTIAEAPVTPTPITSVTSTAISETPVQEVAKTPETKEQSVNKLVKMFVSDIDNPNYEKNDYDKDVIGRIKNNPIKFINNLIDNTKKDIETAPQGKNIEFENEFLKNLENIKQNYLNAEKAEGKKTTAEIPIQEGSKPTDVEVQKADIERRRQEDLSKLPNNGIVSKGDLITVKSNEADAIDAKYDAEVKALESVKPSVKTTEVIPEVTVEGTKQGYQVLSGNKKNAIGDIRQEASEARAAGKDSFTKETVKDGKKTFTLVDATASDDFGRPGFKSASITLPEGTKLTIEDVMPALKAGLKGEKIEPIKIGEKAEVKPTEVTKPIIEKEEVKPTEEAKVASDLVSVSVAPYYDTQIKDISDASKLRESEGYKGHIQMLKKVAKTMGLEINSIDDTIGGFENEQGNKITEISNRVKLNTKDIDAAEKYAAVVGALAHETQEATIAARYVEHGDPNQSAIETELKVSDLNNAVKSLKEAGINSFEINENDNSIKILDFDNGKSKDFNDKMLSFADILDKNNVKYETEHHAIESRYVSPERRAELLKEAKLQAEQQKGGSELRDIYEKSKAKSEEFLSKKELPVEIPEEVHNPIVDKIRKGIQKLSDKAKISVLKGKNFAKALNEAIKTGGANLQSWGGFEKKGFEESPEWKKLIDDGTVKLKFDLKGLEGKTVVVINPDNMLTGEVVTKDGKPIVDGNGGINFVTKYGDVWASSDKSTANTLARYINEARQKDLAAGGDGTVHVVVTKGDLSKSLTSHTGAKAAMKVLEHLVDKKLVSVSDFRKALTEVGKKYNIDFDGRLDSKSIHDDIAKKFFGVNDSTFSKRGFFIQDVIDHLSKNSKSAKENISKIREMLNTEALPKSTERKTGEISFAKEGIIDAIGHLLSDNITVGVKNSEAYATIEIKHPVEVFNLNKEEGGHESYPFHLRQIDKNGNKVKPVLNVLNEAQHVTDVLNDVNNRPVDKKGGAGKFGSNQIGMARGVVKPASEHPSGVNMMTDATGKIYGFEKNGKIVLNADLMNGNTPFHEAGHLWLNWARESRVDLHEAGMTKIEGSKYLQDVKNNPVYQENASKLPELERDAYFKSEALAKAIGDNGEQFVNSAKKADFKQWLKDLWTSIADQFGLRDMTAEQISDLTLDEFSKKVVSDIVGKEKGMEKGLETEGVIEPAKMERKYEEIYKDLTNIEKRQIINSKFEKLLEELKIEKICPTD